MQLAVSVGNAVCEEDLIIFILELVVKTKTVLWMSADPLVNNIVSELALFNMNVLTCLLPIFVLYLVSSFGEDERFHAHFVER